MASNTKYVVLVASVAALGGLLFGFDTGVISGALPFLAEHWTLSDIDQSWITVSVLIGAIAGAAFSGKISDILGRKKIILITALIFAIGSIWTGLAPTFIELIIARIVLGIAIGIASFTVPLYISEIAPVKVRGALVSMNQLMITVGILASYLSDYALADEANPESWRWMFIVGFFPALVLFIGMSFLPESPRWLIMKKRVVEGRAILSKLEEPTMVEEVYKSIEADTKASNEKVSYRELFQPWMRYATMIALVIMIISQLSGINTVIYYSPTIFLKAGFADKTAAIAASMGIGVINVIFTVLSILLIDKWGRRKLYLFGLSGMIVGLVVLGLSFYMQDVMGEATKWVTVISMLLYCSFFSFSIGPLGWLIISEVFPLRTRGIGMSISSMTMWITNTIVAFTFLNMLSFLGTPLTFWCYAAVGVLGLIWGYIYLPETKGVSLETIEKHWRSGKHPRLLNK